MAGHGHPHKSKSASSRRARESAGCAWARIAGLHDTLDLLNKVHVLGLLAHNVEEGLPDDVDVLEPLLELRREPSSRRVMWGIVKTLWLLLAADEGQDAETKGRISAMTSHPAIDMSWRSSVWSRVSRVNPLQPQPLPSPQWRGVMRAVQAERDAPSMVFRPLSSPSVEDEGGTSTQGCTHRFIPVYRHVGRRVGGLRHPWFAPRNLFYERPLFLLVRLFNTGLSVWSASRRSGLRKKLFRPPPSFPVGGSEGLGGQLGIQQWWLIQGERLSFRPRLKEEVVPGS
jgi:hypothetical protein